ncbi:Co-chaperone Hsc20 protein [Dioscorea alata]|uniref:Co-chaperone Hsc20 protein n=1 Tax=Dioscorea alata TaxID=55571 RepID=A0ACB7UC23_DIOAL|nr:Co-chaperone Hsc20 protein [Dioscorea alata]
MESGAYDSGVVGVKLRRRPLRRATAATRYDRPPTAACGGLGGIRNGWLSRLVDPASRIITGGASRLFSSVIRKALPAPPALPVLPPSSGEHALRVSELAIDEKLKSDAFSWFTTGKAASPIIPRKWNKAKPSTFPFFLFCRRSSSYSHHLQEAHSYPYSYVKVSFFSSLLFCDQSFSKNHLDFLHKEFSPSGKWCHTSKSLSQCWSCGKTAASWPFLVCDTCRSVQPMDPSVDYFQIFGLERTYEIKDNNLEGKYKDWQKKLHPDLVHSKSEKERAFAAEQSARVIDAYRTISKPLSRALYMLQLEGLNVDEEKTLTDPDVLSEMMEIREAVEEAGDSDTLKQIQSQIQTKRNNWSNAFREAFEKRDFEDAITSVQRMRYYDRAIEAIVKKL